MFYRGRRSPSLREIIREIIAKTSNLKNAQNFLVELERLFLKSFEGSQMQFQRLVMLQLILIKPSSRISPEFSTLQNKQAFACS